MNAASYTTAGGTWKTFNAGQQRYRDNVLQLFGAQAQPVRVLELIARSFHRVVPPAFLIQVTI